MSDSEKEALYQQWLDYVFNRPYTYGDRWYFTEEDTAFKATNDELVYLVGKTFKQSGIDLTTYSNGQIDSGLCYILDGAGSEAAHALIDQAIDEADRIETIKSMQRLYSDCFAKRCDPVLGRSNEYTENPLNYICYMLWDVSPIIQNNPGKISSFDRAILEVMESALYLDNVACIESGLHGLGHWCSHHMELVQDIIDRFLKNAQNLRPELRQYAEDARVGYIP